MIRLYLFEDLVLGGAVVVPCEDGGPLDAIEIVKKHCGIDNYDTQYRYIRPLREIGEDVFRVAQRDMSANRVEGNGRKLHLVAIPKPRGLNDLPTEMVIEIRYCDSEEWGRNPQAVVLDNVVIPRIIDALNGTPR